MFSLHNHNNLGRSTCFFILKDKNLSSFKVSLVPLNSLSLGNSKTAAEDIYKYHPEQKKKMFLRSGDIPSRMKQAYIC